MGPKRPAAATSPATAIAEKVCGAWLKELLRLPASASFAFVTGCQIAHTTALAAARHKVLAERGWDVDAKGLAGAPPIRVLPARTGTSRSFGQSDFSASVPRRSSLSPAMMAHVSDRRRSSPRSSRQRGARRSSVCRPVISGPAPLLHELTLAVSGDATGGPEFADHGGMMGARHEERNINRAEVQGCRRARRGFVAICLRPPGRG